VPSAPAHCRGFDLAALAAKQFQLGLVRLSRRTFSTSGGISLSRPIPSSSA
jgi:hypothetical protein